MHSEHDDTESSELELSDEEGVAEAPSRPRHWMSPRMMERPPRWMKASCALQDDEDEDEDEEDVILNAAMLELGSVSDDDEASVEFTDGGSSAGATESKTDDQSEAEVSDTSDTASSNEPKRPKRKKKSRETVPAAPLRQETV